MAPKPSGKHEDVTDNAHKDADLHGELAADLVAQPAEEERAARRADLAEGEHHVHRECKRKGRRLPTNWPTEGVRDDRVLHGGEADHLVGRRRGVKGGKMPAGAQLRHALGVHDVRHLLEDFHRRSRTGLVHR